MFTQPLVQTMANFLTHIGLEVRACTALENSFLPGIEVRGGVLWVDESRLTHPGDLLHEAGHLALMTRAERASTHAEVTHADAAVWEVAAIAWSYAAALHLKIAPQEVLHDGGYHGQAQALLGVYPGLPTLVSLGLTQVNTTEANYPAMQRWLRSE